MCIRDSIETVRTETVTTTATTVVPTSIAPPQPFWTRFPVAWLAILLVLLIIGAAIGIYYYRKQKAGEVLFEEE